MFSSCDCASTKKYFLQSFPEMEGEVKDVMHEFLTSVGGQKVINKILIANNGIAAVKCIRSIRHWCYKTFKNEHAVQFVSLVTSDDIQANAEYIKLSDYCVQVPSGPNYRNYANVSLIVEIALKYQVQAVWAGWGHASENPELPNNLGKHGVIFMGPPAKAMWALGDKIASTIVAQTAGVPTMPWSGSGLQVACEGEVSIPEELYLRGCIADAESGLQVAQRLGFPVMIKASEGGGGKGIRKVDTPDTFHALYKQVSAEVPNSPIFVMKVACSARHIEVQLLADAFGGAISLFSRDCSLQRRHQKIVEEAPATAVPPHVLRHMEESAVKLAKLVGYVSAGTVEYLYDEDGKYYFLELNPRLQVEHPCTEMITNVNLPACQLQIAMGIPLHRIQDIRQLYGEAMGDSPINWENPRHKPTPNGHVIAARITCEDPNNGFKPSCGQLKELNFHSFQNVWAYFSVSAGGSLHEYADSQFGHCFSWGENREMARDNLLVALKQLTVRADFQTIVECLVELMEMPEFQYNAFTTSWLDGLISENKFSDNPNILLAVTCGAIHLAYSKIETAFDSFEKALKKGQYQDPSVLSNSLKVELIHKNVKYSVLVSKTGNKSFWLIMNDSILEVEVEYLSDSGLLIIINGGSYTTYMNEFTNKYCLTINRKNCFFDKENDPSLLLALSPGKLLNCLLKNGESVSVDQPFAEVEVMKMVMTLTSKCSGKIFYQQCPGAILEAGTVIANIELDDPSQVTNTIKFEGQFQENESTVVDVNNSIHKLYNRLQEIIESYMKGFCPPEPYYLSRLEEVFQKYTEVIQDLKLPLYQLTEEMSSGLKLPEKVEEQINSELLYYKNNLHSTITIFPSREIGDIINRYALQFQTPLERKQFLDTTKNIEHTVDLYKDGIKMHVIYCLCHLLDEYYTVEKYFQKGSYDECVADLLHHLADEKSVTAAIFSHLYVTKKNSLLVLLMNYLENFKTSMPDSLINSLYNLASLHQSEQFTIALRARKLLLSVKQPCYKMRYNQLESIFLLASENSSNSLKLLKKLTACKSFILDVLHDFFYHVNERISSIALELFVLVSYQSYTQHCLKHVKLGSSGNSIFYCFESPLNSCERSMGVASCTYTRGCVIPYLSLADFQERLVKLLVGKELLLNTNLKCSETMRAEDNSPLDEKAAGSNFTLNIAIKGCRNMRDEECSDQFEEFCVTYEDLLKKNLISKIVFMILLQGEYPKFFSYNLKESYEEDRLYRHIVPSQALLLELDKLDNYKISALKTSNPRICVYVGKAKNLNQPIIEDKRLFVRSVVQPSEILNQASSTVHFMTESEKVLIEAICELEVAFLDPDNGGTDRNHIFLNFNFPVIMNMLELNPVVESLVKKYYYQLWKLRTLNIEMLISLKKSENEPSIKVRVLVQNESGLAVKVSCLVSDTTTQEMHCETGQNTLQNDSLVNNAYKVKTKLHHKRYLAQKVGTTYVYDIPDVFEQMLLQLWKEFIDCSLGQREVPLVVLNVSELVLDSTTEELREVSRPLGQNSVGMVVWLFKMFTPEYPGGRDIIVIANDITFVSGSFSPSEDLVFFKASEMARERQIPRIYISANSGARIGLAEEVKQLFKIAWKDNNDPNKGFEYLYLTQDDFEKISHLHSVEATKIVDEGETRHKITAIIGKEDGFGVENLRGAGLIAGETSRAYQEIVTISMVSCRAIGIGSYLVRLGQRVVQVEKSHIILTGNQALNKLLGRNVYISNNQLGGLQVMFNNGITHQKASDDFHGIYKILKWLSYIPKDKLSPVPIINPVDPVGRTIDFKPTKMPYDPRWMLEGRQSPEDPAIWESGFFDKGSWDEILKPWAPSVVCGRARLGGIPVGVIAVETRTINVILPADPTNENSEMKSVTQAGQVWYPDSSFKTAQVIQDFGKEGLPLIIFANWRGFSGGMKDMFEQVMKFGSYIIDGLRAYTQPIIIYLPPHAELRGGAWAVIDTTINPECIEMYADPESRGGVLGPEGIVEIRFRAKDMIKSMHRNDPVILSTSAELKSERSEERKLELKELIANREKFLMPIYLQVAINFADLHDVPNRMIAKEVIEGIVPWKESRFILFCRLLRLLRVNQSLSIIKQLQPTLSGKRTKELLHEYFLEENKCASHNWDDNEKVATWLKEKLEDGSLASTFAKRSAEKNTSLSFISEAKDTHDIVPIIESEMLTSKARDQPVP